MSFPSTFSLFTRPNTTDKLNAPSHSALHNTVSSAVGQLEAVVGLSGDSSVIGTIIGDLRSPDSNGGGHIQTAIKGGTGQITYTKGDILVATSSSVLAKLSVSSVAGEVLTIDPNQAGGMKWAARAAATKIDARYMHIVKNAGEASVMTVYYACSVLGSTLGTNNAIRYSVNFPTFSLGATSTSVQGQIIYGNNVVTSFNMPTTASESVVGILNLEGYIIAASSVNSQISYLKGSLVKPNVFKRTLGVTGNELDVHAVGTSSVESTATQPLIVQLRVTGGSNETGIESGIGITEKIA